MFFCVKQAVMRWDLQQLLHWLRGNMVKRVRRCEAVMEPGEHRECADLTRVLDRRELLHAPDSYFEQLYRWLMKLRLNPLIAMRWRGINEDPGGG